MAMINCTECGKPISSNAIVCPHCGNPLQNDPTERKLYNIIKRLHKPTFIIAGTILIVCLLLMLGIVLKPLWSKSRQTQSVSIPIETVNSISEYATTETKYHHCIRMIEGIIQVIETSSTKEELDRRSEPYAREFERVYNSVPREEWTEEQFNAIGDKFREMGRLGKTKFKNN